MIVIGFLLILIAGISKAIMDTLNFHFSTSIFNTKSTWFWNPKFSSFNKYKNQDPKQGPRFFGSTTFFVWVTDAWHLFQMVKHMTLIGGFLLLGYASWNAWSLIGIGFIGGYILYNTIFELFYSKIFRK